MPHTVEKIEKLSDSRTRVAVTFEKETVAQAEKKALEHLSQHIKVPGFRPGKVPENLAQEKVSPDDLLEETIRELLPETFRSIVKENDLKPIIPPKVELQKRDPLSLHITFVGHPEVKVAANKIKVEKKEPKADEKDVDTMVNYVLEQQKSVTEVDRAAKEGDQVTMDFVGKDKDGKEIEGIRTENYKVILGKKTLIPGFEEELIGLAKGGKKSFTLKFPDKYHAEHLRNQPVTFDVTVSKVEEVTIPELTDSYAKDQLQAESAADFRSKVKESMIAQERSLERQRREQALFEAIREATKVDIPPELVEDEEHHLLEELMRQLDGQKMTIKDYLQRNNQTQEDFIKDVKDRSSKRLQLRLGIRQLMEDQKIDITDDEMVHIVQEFLATVPAEERERIAPLYQGRSDNYEQLKWQKKVEKMMEQFLAA